MTFGEAIESAKMGKKILRAGWNGKGMWVEKNAENCLSLVLVPDLIGVAAVVERAKLERLVIALQEPTSESLFMNTVKGELVPWLISQTDALAEDWSVLE